MMLDVKSTILDLLDLQYIYENILVLGKDINNLF